MQKARKHQKNIPGFRVWKKARKHARGWREVFGSRDVKLAAEHARKSSEASERAAPAARTLLQHEMKQRRRPVTLKSARHPALPAA
jgi:hypothetical protein